MTAAWSRPIATPTPTCGCWRIPASSRGRTIAGSATSSPATRCASRQQGVDAYTLLNEAAASVPPGSDGLIMLPCLMGAMAPTWNALARGTFMGFTLAHRREHFCRAILEGSAYALRDITDQMLRMGLPLQEIRVVGGGARSPLWRQIKADVTGLPVSITDTVETTALGAGILALAGSG